MVTWISGPVLGHNNYDLIPQPQVTTDYTDPCANKPCGATNYVCYVS